MSALRTEPEQSAPNATPPKARWGGAREIGDWWQELGISGAFAGTNGKIFRAGFAALVVFITGYDTITVWSYLHDQPDLGLAAPLIWEGTSAFGFVVYSMVAWAALQIAPLERRPVWHTALVHALAIPVYSLLHVATFVVLRSAVYALAGHHYDYGPFGAGFFYEFRKDIFAYLLMVIVYWVTGRLLRDPPVPAETIGMFAIRDGTRIVRVAIADILAISSAGNYVEFLLRDGRRPLMRSPLSAIETELAQHGFVRVHRSWLVNAMQMTGLKPEGSGDYTVELGDLSVPLSRRFPEALAKLRAA